LKKSNAKELEDFESRLTAKFQTLQMQSEEKIESLETVNKELMTRVVGYDEPFGRLFNTVAETSGAMVELETRCGCVSREEIDSTTGETTWD
jgi:hypothetical protein